MEKAYTDSKLCKQIMKSRDIKENSCRTYLGSLRKIKKEMTGDNTSIDDTEFLRDFDEVMDIIDSEKKITTRKNRLTAVIVALGSDKEANEKLIKKFQDELDKLNNEYMSFLKKQKKTEAQEENWLDYRELVSVVNSVGEEVRYAGIHGAKQGTLDDDEMKLLQDYVVLRVYLDFPLRNDFADMKVVSLDEYKKIPEKERMKNNYLVKKNNKLYFYINAFKNKSKIGSKIFDIPKGLEKLIKLWLKHNKTGWFLIKNNTNEPLSPNGITKLLNKIFKKRVNKLISTSMIRHIIISHELRNEKTIKEKEKDESRIKNRFLHSGLLNELYRKK
jgi:hypothetical protein